MENQISCIWFSTASDSCRRSAQLALLFRCSCLGTANAMGIHSCRQLVSRPWCRYNCRNVLQQGLQSTDSPGPVQVCMLLLTLALGCAAPLACSYSWAQELQGQWSPERWNTCCELRELSWAISGPYTGMSLPLLRSVKMPVIAPLRE